VDSLRKALQQAGKDYANRASKAPNKRAATAVAEEGSQQLQQMFSRGSRTLEDLKGVARQLRALPYVDPAVPTLALVGAPNVGKSSLVKVLSTGTPDVCNYPFTTRSIKMGHFFIDGARHQVTDTPGLLARSDDQRNKMELLTLAALDHLPSSVMFVFDATEECGTSISEQWEIYQELRARYPTKPWVDVISKADLLQQEIQEMQQHTPQAGTPMHAAAAAAAEDAQLSAGSSQPPPAAAGLESAEMHTEKAMRLSAAAGAMAGGGDSEPPVTAVQLLCALPEAVHVSSLTGSGLEQLQQQVIGIMLPSGGVLPTTGVTSSSLDSSGPDTTSSNGSNGSSHGRVQQ
jgi:nucleolar GTP-binding protein